MRTRAFRSGNSQAVRIPAEIAYGDITGDLEITRNGDVIMIRPAVGGLQAAIEELRRMPPLEPHKPLERPDPRRTFWDEEQ